MTSRLRRTHPAARATSVHRSLIEHSTGWILLDRDGCVAEIAPQTAASLSMNSSDVVGAPLSSLVAEPDLDWVRQGLADPTQVIAGTPVGLRHHARLRPVDFDVSLADDATGIRLVLTDSASWRAAEHAARWSTASRSAAVDLEHSAAFVLRLDSQCSLTWANDAWRQLTGAALMWPTPDQPISPSTWLRAIDTDTVTALGHALTSLRSGGSFEAAATVFGTTSEHQVSISACATTGEHPGFIIVGFERGPARRVMPQPAPAAVPRDPIGQELPADPPPDALDERTDLITDQTVIDTPTTEHRTVIDQRTQTIIASVLSAARTARLGDEPSPDADRAEPVSFEPGLFDVADDLPVDYDEADTNSDGQIGIPSRQLEDSARLALTEQLHAMHQDGLDAIVSIALVSIEVTLDVQDISAGEYEMRVLERRMRAAIRDHEYGDRHSERGFVVAARGGFGHGELQSLALRLANRLSAPLRGHEDAGPLSVHVAAVRSTPHETDDSLIGRLEAASAHAQAHQMTAYVVG